MEYNMWSLRPDYFVQQNIFNISMCWKKNQFSIYFYCWINFHPMNISHFIYPFIYWQTFGYLLKLFKLISRLHFKYFDQQAIFSITFLKSCSSFDILPSYFSSRWNQVSCLWSTEQHVFLIFVHNTEMLSGVLSKVRLWCVI